VISYRFADGASPWFVEGGIGATVTSSVYRSTDKHFSTAFNFGDHVGLDTPSAWRGERTGPAGGAFLERRHQASEPRRELRSAAVRASLRLMCSVPEGTRTQTQREVAESLRSS
jgi:hypothetical protein